MSIARGSVRRFVSYQPFKKDRLSMQLLFSKKLLLLFCGLLSACVFVILSSSLGISSSFFYTFIGVLTTGYLFGSLQRLRGLGFNLVWIFITCLIVAIALEGMTLFGDPLASVLQLGSWRLARILLFGFMVYVGLSLLLFSGTKEHSIEGHHPGIFESVRMSIASLFRAPLMRGFLSASLAAVALFALFVASTALFDRRLLLMVYLVMTGLCCGFCVYAYRKRKSISFDVCVLCVIIFLGSFMSFALPPITGYSWDDETHYDRALGLSYLGDPACTPADGLLASKPWCSPELPAVGSSGMNQAIQQVSEANNSGIDRISRQSGFVTPYWGSSMSNLATLGYMPSALGLWLARLFHFPPVIQFIMGRWFNLLSFALIAAFAVRVVPIKKSLVAAIALLPTNLFLAAQYSYDAVVVSYLLLAVSLVVRELVEGHGRLTPVKLAVILCVFIIGLAPKAIYFPLLGLLLLIPSDSFSTERAHKLFCLLVAAVALVLIASFLMPLLFSASAQAGDARGGADVSASGQILFILTHPFEYFGILWRFMVNYISPIVSDQYATFFAYLGIINTRFAWLATTPLFCLFGCAIFNSSEYSILKVKRGGAFFALFLVVISIVLVITALYVSFTPVGLGTVNGCQPRYILPVVFPALFFAPCALPGISCVKQERAAVSPGVLAISFMILLTLVCLESLY